MDDECGRILKKAGGIIPVTYALPTKAYNLPYKGIIHAVGPIMGDGDEGEKIKKTIKHALIAADYKKWKSIAFPAISTGLFRVPKEVCAEAFKNAVPDYWQDNPDSGIETVWLCLVKEDYDIFRKIMS